MASLVESGLTNVQGGDRDSVGFFQMRTGIWDEGPYKGFQQRPELQLKWFIDHALAVKKERLAAGDSAFLHDPSKWGNWIADVERPAEEYRGRYQLRLDEAKGLLHQAGPPAPSPAAAAAAAPAAGAVADQVASPVPGDPNTARALGAIAIARKYLGTPYHWGGSDPSTGFDCSGIVQYAYKQMGVDLPRVTYTQVNVGEHIDRAHLRPGDVLFFRDSTGDIHHEALYIGGGKFLHAPHTGDVIKISSLDEPYYRDQFMGGRRVAQLAAPGAPVPNVPGAPAAAPASPSPVGADVAPTPQVPAAGPPPGGSVVVPAVGAEQASAPAPHGTLQFAAVADQHAGATPAVAGDTLDVLPDGSDVYPGDNAPKEQVAAWMARQAHKAGLPSELPVMASLVESGLTNVQGGDRDSVGFFQMRTGIWDEGPYKGFQQRPELQLKWFLDHALEVKRQRIARGDSAFLRDSSKWGQWIADVERPAEQYRGRYQLRLDEARGLLHQAGPPAPTPTALQHAGPSAAADLVAPAPGDPNHARALAALAIARKYMGTPYKWGGSDPSTGFDCSGIVQYAYKQVGVDLPRVTYTQVNVGEHIDRAHLQAGDILFFRDSSGDIHHEAMYIGGGKFLHAPHTGDVIKISSLDEPYYRDQFMGGRRVAQLAAPGAPVPQVPGAPAAAPAAAPPPVAASPPPVVADPAAPPVPPAAPPAGPAPGGSVVIPAVGSEQAASPTPPRSTVKFMPAVDPNASPRPSVDPGHPADAAAGGSSGSAAADVASSIPAGPDAYPGDNAPKEQLAAWMARAAHKAGLPGELPVMAALVESTLHNHPGGDADSAGFFQMRQGIWDKGEYAGFQHKPELQLKWFIDHALAVKQQRIARGDSAFVNDPSRWGDWIADIERPAEQYRGRYQLHLDEARKLLAVAR
jgi:cell wall-associated NlpC family hydrolase